MTVDFLLSDFYNQTPYFDDDYYYFHVSEHAIINKKILNR